ncbi:PREDICTED: collagen alpha-1(XXI) chain-like [Amphimedon queenslandica]|uniref:Uncharacterized protein n=1 Tax=Amphimedon queenslandica TaxID=400682 RepID=A0A1X7SQ86_AMPQE|nr:PREDICTED: collagen alpha-1(XXI) chain-like [Amphimedon queenslandica]|eukprot:XP_019863124.1 PREDICTED: collagen alpha-1(XXI) chain-like [Amphimedon queenslandica]
MFIDMTPLKDAIYTNGSIICYFTDEVMIANNYSTGCVVYYANMGQPAYGMRDNDTSTTAIVNTTDIKSTEYYVMPVPLDSIYINVEAGSSSPVHINCTSTGINFEPKELVMAAVAILIAILIAFVLGTIIGCVCKKVEVNNNVQIQGVHMSPNKDSIHSSPEQLRNSGEDSIHSSPGQLRNSGENSMHSSPGQFRNSGEESMHSSPGQLGNSGENSMHSSPGQFRNSGEDSMHSSPGQLGNSGENSMHSSPGQFRNSGEDSMHSSPGQLGNSGENSMHSSPGQFRNSGEDSMHSSPGQLRNSGENSMHSSPGQFRNSGEDSMHSSPGQLGNSGENSMHSSPEQLRNLGTDGMNEYSVHNSISEDCDQDGDSVYTQGFEAQKASAIHYVTGQISEQDQQTATSYSTALGGHASEVEGLLAEEVEMDQIGHGTNNN